MEKLSNEVQINSSLVDHRQNLALAMYTFQDINIDKDFEIYGVVNRTNNFPELKFTNYSDEALLNHVVLTSAFLRKMVKLRKDKKITLTSFLFKRRVFFDSNIDNAVRCRKDLRINGKIISLKVNGMHVTNLTGDEEIQSYFKPKSRRKFRRISCVYWNFNAKGSTFWRSILCRDLVCFRTIGWFIVCMVLS